MGKNRSIAWVVLTCCTAAAASTPARPPEAGQSPAPLVRSDPDLEGISSTELIALTEWIRDSPAPVFSLLISRHGKLVYELYAPAVGPDDAHYLMSVTKSVLSALLGIAIDRRLIAGPAAALSSLLPRSLFPAEADLARLGPLTLKQVMGMSAVDAPEAVTASQKFSSAPNRVSVALQQPLLTQPFQYNEATPALAVGALQYAVGKSALEFAEQTLFRPMGFRNYEWMHQDGAGIDNGGFGLRLRPIDMQKFGLLYLNHGAWSGEQLISREWVDQTFQPWNRSKPGSDRPDYGWFWWTSYYAPGWTAHVANGWKGQRIAVIPDQDLVVTMTACIEDGTEAELFAAIVTRFLVPAVQRSLEGQKPARAGALADALAQVHAGRARIARRIQPRMVPSSSPKTGHQPFAVKSGQ